MVMVTVMMMVVVTPARSSPVASSLPVLCLLRPRVASARRNTADWTRTQGARPRAQGCCAQRKRSVPERGGSAPPPRPLRLLRALPRTSRRPLGGGPSAPTAPRRRLAGRARPEPGTTRLARIPRRERPRPGPAPRRARPNPRPATGHLRLRWALRLAAPRQRLRGRCAAGCSPSLGCRGPGGGWGGGDGEEGKGSQGRGRRTTGLRAGAARPKPFFPARRAPGSSA
ncbi:unnamed protein product [Rangifer tarandus platyrhynchus]|uniref:Uncharacterized protein n=2 Tax=Rangifer tarandus platyrhynchus TaxID=3082113 RepID=A0ACB0EZG2_RANTA|nr:unnamed protein product [Rangifer tarandus platyrhynchus]CAI9706163.1 unnamed protein product [Rangifer tarandus platyrhynchus]